MTMTDIEWNRGPDAWRPRLPYQPLAAWLGDNAPQQIVAATGRDRSTAWRWAERGITDIEADKVACAFGVHPAVIWGDWWWWTAPEPEPEPAGRFCGRHPR